jgi:hypothetical protein
VATFGFESTARKCVARTLALGYTKAAAEIGRKQMMRDFYDFER